MRLFSRRRPYEKRFAGTWEDRIADLFDAGIDFRGRTVLDVGCNMGIVAYEVSKKSPETIHGLDVYKPAIRIARRIFSGVPIKHRFDVVDICDERKLRSCLSPSYDIVLLLSVWHHLRDRNGVQAADRAASQIAMRCKHALIARVPPELAGTFGELLAPLGFRQVYRSPSRRGTLSIFLAFERSSVAKEAALTPDR
jgi:SAM-dependent methyltransferase